VFDFRQGEDWQKMRSTVNPILMQPKFVRSYIPTIDQIVNEFLANIPKMQDENSEMPGNFNEFLNRWSLESITAIALEKRLGLMDLNNNTGIGGRITKNVRKIFDLAAEFELRPSIWKIYPTKKFKELMNAYNDLTE
jgi:cytochrome P450 family 12